MNASSEKKTGLAIARLVFSILGLLSYGLSAVVGIILGHVAQSRIKREPRVYGGEGIATAGLIIGYIVVIGGLLVTLFWGGLWVSL